MVILPDLGRSFQGFANTVERLDLEKKLVDRAVFEEGQFAGEPMLGVASLMPGCAMGQSAFHLGKTWQ